MTAASCLILKFRSYEDPETFDRRVEASAIDADTANTVASLPLIDMAEWLRESGYKWRFGSSGVWEKAS